MNNTKIGIIAIGIIVIIVLIWIISAVVNDKITADQLHSKLLSAYNHEMLDNYINRTMIITGIRVGMVDERRRDGTDFVIIWGNVKDSRQQHISILIDINNPALKETREKALALEMDNIISVKTSIQDFITASDLTMIILGGKNADVQILDIKRGGSF